MWPWRKDVILCLRNYRNRTGEFITAKLHGERDEIHWIKIDQLAYLRQALNIIAHKRGDKGLFYKIIHNRICDTLKKPRRY